MSDGDLLILGASGFLGPHLVAAARRAGWRVVSASRRAAAAPYLPGQAPDAVLELDALVPGALEQGLDAVRPRAIVLASALSRVDECERDPARAQALNCALPGALARATRARGLRLVHLSTDLVFGARAPRAARYSEDDVPSPVHVYGASKAAGEARVRQEDPAALIVRLPLLYGDSLGRGLGAGDALLAALARGERPALFTDEWRTPLAAGNAAAAVIELVGRGEHGLRHVAGPLRLARYQLGLALLAAHGIQDAAARIRPATRAEFGLDSLRPRDVALGSSRAPLRTPLLAPDPARVRP